MLTTDNVQYASVSDIIQEIQELEQNNAPTTYIEVLKGVLLERKENIEKMLVLYEDALHKVSQNGLILSLVDNYKLYQRKLETINNFLQ